MFAVVRSWPLFARLAVLLVGLALYGIAIRLQLDAAVGLAPWDIFHQGLAEKTGLSFGFVSILVGVALFAVSWAWLGIRPGVGSFLNMVLIGLFIDVLGGRLPVAESVAGRWAQFVLGILLLGLATGTYVAANLGAGPRDSTVLGLVSRFRLPVAPVRAGIEGLVLLSGWALGGHLGLGTLVFAVLIGPSMAFGLGLFGLRGKE